MANPNIETLLSETRTFSASSTFKSQANATADLYEHAEKDRLRFWDEQARDLHWFKEWHSVLEWNRPHAKWFLGGTLNASTNCLDVHLQDKAEKTAIIWEGENGRVSNYSYQDLHEEVCQLAHALQQSCQVQKGDRVTLYMPMIPELAVAVLACARIGAIHSVVFAGFSADSLRDRIEDSGSKLIITANGGYRRGQIIPLRQIVENAVTDSPIEHIISVKHITDPEFEAPSSHIDVDYHTLIQEQPTTHQAEEMDSEDPLFILYTSGTTGKPKGIVHSTGGYMTHAKYSTKMIFDLKDEDIYWCTADIGWITGHSYLVYGPLANGATVLMYEGSPDYPNKSRFWELIDKHQVSIFYTAPTAIRAFMQWGESYISPYSLDSLRLLGTVGEPINPEAWTWYHDKIGKGNCPIVDTWWQTETGGIMISNLPALNDMKPGHAGPPLPGISAKILDPQGGNIETGGGLLSLTEPWPSMLRGVWGDEQRYKDTYWSKFDSYFAGDGATIDDEGYYMVLGRIDDVLNVAGHRIGTMEVESALVEYTGVAEAAVVGMPDEIKGQSIAAFVILEAGVHASPGLERALIAHVSNKIGPIAKPKKVLFTPELPKTRSGKIMRRLLKNIAEGQAIGDCTTLANPDSVKNLEIQWLNSDRVGLEITEPNQELA